MSLPIELACRGLGLRGVRLASGGREMVGWIGPAHQGLVWGVRRYAGYELRWARA